MRGARDDRAVLQHILEVHKVAVVHMLSAIVRVMEMDDAGFVRVDNLLRQQHAAREILETSPAIKLNPKRYQREKPRSFNCFIP